MYRPLRMFKTTLGQPYVMYKRFIYAIMLCIKSVSCMEGFIECTVNVHAQALN